MKKEIISSAIDSRTDKLNAISDDIWGYAETAFLEFKSADRLCKALEDEGFKVERNVGNIETAFTGTFGSGKPVIGILGEFDALYGLQQTSGKAERECEKPEAAGHGCGHHLLGVGSLAAAIAVKEYLQKTGKSGTVIYFGTPGEEGGSSKAFLARDGVFDGLDAAITWHPSSINTARATTSLANIQAKFRFHGQQAHAAAVPHKGRSALDAAELMNVGVQFMREHVKEDARIHYSFTNAGGKSPNVVQADAEMIYLVRSPRLKEAKEMYEWVCDIARGAAMMTQTKLEIELMKGASNVVVNKTIEKLLAKNMELFGLPEITDEDRENAAKFYATYKTDLEEVGHSYEKFGEAYVNAYKNGRSVPICEYIFPQSDAAPLNSASTDVGDVSWVCPTSQLLAANYAFQTPGHSWQMVAQGKLPLAHKMTMFAGKAMAGAVIDLIENPGEIEKAKAEFKTRVGSGYDCPVPKGIKPQVIK